MAYKSKIRAVVFFLVLIFLAAAIRFSGISVYLDQARLREMDWNGLTDLELPGRWFIL